MAFFITDKDILGRLDAISYQLNRVLANLSITTAKEQLIMVSVADIQAKATAALQAIQAETDVVNAVKTLVDTQNAAIAGLKKQVTDLISAGSATATDLQALSDTIDAIASSETSNAATVSAAVAAGTAA
jgi:type I site-specific restriction endonuclease